jgi:hypothetical protein
MYMKRERDLPTRRKDHADNEACNPTHYTFTVALAITGDSNIA